MSPRRGSNRVKKEARLLKSETGKSYTESLRLASGGKSDTTLQQFIEDESLRSLVGGTPDICISHSHEELPFFGQLSVKGDQFHELLRSQPDLLDEESAQGAIEALCRYIDSPGADSDRFALVAHGDSWGPVDKKDKVTRSLYRDRLTHSFLLVTVASEMTEDLEMVEMTRVECGIWPVQDTETHFVLYGWFEGFGGGHRREDRRSLLPETRGNTDNMLDPEWSPPLGVIGDDVYTGLDQFQRKHVVAFADKMNPKDNSPSVFKDTADVIREIKANVARSQARAREIAERLHEVIDVKNSLGGPWLYDDDCECLQTPDGMTLSFRELNPTLEYHWDMEGPLTDNCWSFIESQIVSGWKPIHPELVAFRDELDENKISYSEYLKSPAWDNAVWPEHGSVAYADIVETLLRSFKWDAPRGARRRAAKRLGIEEALEGNKKALDRLRSVLTFARDNHLNPAALAAHLIAHEEPE